MRVTRILDLVVLMLLAAVGLMPRPNVTVKPALQLDPELRDPVAELQAILGGHPDAVAPALEAANIYPDGPRPDWAWATVDAALKTPPDAYRLHHVRAIAFADRFEGQPAFEAATRAAELCDRTPSCGEAAHARISLLKSTLEAVAGVDMRKYPYIAKERIFERLHPVFVPRRKPGAKVTAPAPKPPGPPGAPAAPPAKAP